MEILLIPLMTCNTPVFTYIYNYTVLHEVWGHNLVTFEYTVFFQIGAYQTWGQVHEYLYLSTFKYTSQSTCTLLKYFLISAGVLVLILKYYVEYLYVLGYL